MKCTIPTGLWVLVCMGGCNSEGPVGGDGHTVQVASPTMPQPATTTEFVHFEGNWLGTLTSDVTGNSSTAIALVNGWGEFRLITNGAQFIGWPRRTATNLSGGVTGIRDAGSTWNNGNPTSYFALVGTISEDNFIEATYRGSGDSGMLAMAWSPEEQSVTIGSLDGTWVEYDESRNIVATIQIDASGAWQAGIYGSHVNGCTFAGETEAWTSYYSYDVVPFEVSGCPQIAGIELNGGYSGTAALVNLPDDHTDEPALVVAVSNDLYHQLSFFLHRVTE